MAEINLEDARRQFLDFMESLGVAPYEESEIQLDGELHRYRTRDDKLGNLSGAYCVHAEGLPAGFVQDWRKGVNEMKRLEMSERARRLWDRLSQVPETHGYLQRKKVQSYGLRYNASTDCLAVPLRTVDGVLMSIQWIPSDASKHKQFYEGASLKGAFWSVGLNEAESATAGIILLGEGYATMSKVHELTGYPCAAAMSCYRLSEIAKILHEHYPSSKILICADNDKATERERGYNPGLREAYAAEKRGFAFGVIYPEFKSEDDGTDWDDYAEINGDTDTSTLLQEKITEALRAPRIEGYRRQAEELGILRSEPFSEFVIPKGGSSWLIDGWIPSEGTVMLFAPSGSGKSFVTIDMAFAVACSEIDEWQGQKILRHGTVIYFAGEGQRGMRKRCAGLAAARGIDPSKVKMHIISDMLSIDDPDVKHGLTRAIANIGMLSAEIVMVIFDTTNVYMSGDENKTSDATKYLRSCKAISNEFGCVVQIVNHTGLSQETQNRARGSSAFKAAVDIELKVSKAGAIITLEMTKSKDTELARAKKFSLEEVEVPGYYDTYGRPERTCILADAYDLPETTPTDKTSSEAEEFALRTYSEAAKRYGELHEDESGREYVRVNIEDWRKVCYELSSADNVNTKRQHFNRVRKRLLETLRILSKEETDGEEYYKLNPSGNAYELGIITHIHNQR